MYDDVMAVRVEAADVICHLALLFRSLCIFFAEIPVQRELIAESRDHLSQVKLPLGPEVAAIERFRNRLGTRRLSASAIVVVVFRLLQFEVEIQALSLRVVEDDLR